MADLRIAIAHGPECPACHVDGFDDWWHDKTVRSAHSLVVAMTGSLRCHGCGKFFAVTAYHDGLVHSTMRTKA